MKVKFRSTGGFNNALKWFKEASNVKSSDLKKIADYGTTCLSDGTPEDTGETSSGWEYDITKNRNSSEIAWRNTAHPESEVNVAKLIELGHGTKTGGYVAPKPYIRQSMEPVWKKADTIMKEMMK